MPSAASTLRAVRLVHTLIWAFFAGSVVAVPASAWAGRYGYAAVFSGVVFVEVLILAFNKGRCPFTGLAARYTDDRRDNFDIYLPEWLARNNKLIFGTIYVAGVLLTAVRWAGWF